MPDAIARRLEAEMLDILPATDPRARRCRRDLRFINWLVGNHRWIRRMLSKFPEAVRAGVVELGAGDGSFLVRLDRRFPDAGLTGFDLSPRPANLPDRIHWFAGDLFQSADDWPGAVLVANFFLHHFTFDHIAQLGARLKGVRLLLIGEAHRSPEILRRSCVLNPFLGEVTRHDMEISLAAAFVPGELPSALGLSVGEWQVTERVTSLGALRLLAIRRQGPDLPICRSHKACAPS